MDPLDANTHSFIVKIWLEKTAQKTGRAVWRGHITHVPGGERSYFENLEAIRAFIMPYLIRMGVKMDTGWRLRQWLKRCKSQVKLDG